MSGKSQFALLKTERFLPLFVTQALSAFNDNAFRFAVASIMISSLGKEQGGLVNTIAAALFVGPYLLFSATAGQLADKYDKARVARLVRLVEILVVALSVFALYSSSIVLKQFCIFLAGTQAAFFGPVKYSILPQHLTKDELLGGNGLVEMATFLAVLLGTIFGNQIVEHPSGKLVMAVIMVTLALVSYWTAARIPPAPSAEPDLKINWNLFSETWSNMKLAAVRKPVLQAIFGISWFWLIGIVLVTQMQLFTADSLKGTAAASSMVFGLFSVGIALGSIFCNTLLDGKISVKFVPLAALLISLFLIDLYFSAGRASTALEDGIARGTMATQTTEAGDRLLPFMSVLSVWQSWHPLFDMLAISFSSGLFVVPLYAIVQTRTPYYLRARIIGSNNIINAVFMVAATIACIPLLGMGLSARGLFLTLGITNLAAVIYILRILPHDTLSAAARGILRFFYKVEVKGLEHYEAAGRKALIIANHTSFLDGILLSAFLPDRAAFAIDTEMAKAWWVRPAFALFDLCPIDPANPLALRTLVNELKHGKRVVIFPEGRLTTTGSLMKVYEGPGAVAEMAKGKILPVRIDGAQYTPFSRLRGKLPIRWFPKITLTFLPPVKMDSPPQLKGSALREHQAEKLYDVMSGMVFRTSKYDSTLWQSLLDARAAHGGKRRVLEDIQRKRLNYNRTIMGAFILGRKLAQATPGQKNVALLLPNATGTILSLFGLLAYGRVPAMLNFSTGAINMSAACVAAEISTIVTSRKFIELGEMQEDLKLLSQNRRIIYLEDLRDGVTFKDKLFGFYASRFPQRVLKNASRDPNDPAVILFTSGSEGVPKGVVLSHRNLNACRNQVAARLAFAPDDIIFNALPVFHAFGLLGGVMLPLMSGIYTFHYPSPLHYKVIPELVYGINATALFGTDTFLTGYAKNAHPYDFYSTRLVVAGAERVKPETYQMWMDKFGIRIIEGYGATECAPVIALNTPMHWKAGTVGRVMDAIDWRLDPVEGIAEGGRLVVRGPNVMRGYLRSDNPGVIEEPQDGWYDTGDIVSVDERGFVTILGRAKRFCKIAGEMVSLTAVELAIQRAYPDLASACVAVPDAKKGEQLVLFVTSPELDRKAVSGLMKQQGVSDLMIPRNIVQLEALPLLGSGKADYMTLNRMAREKFAG
jgi:acyl-[acyl-carrier-protein]-phospholipid O-acyltransferase / long-chain-fatty-acid--[acyl-carrier-protein] ligase